MCSPVAEAGLQIFSGFQASDAAKEQGKAFDNAAQIEEQNRGFAISRAKESRDQVLAQNEASFAEGGIGGGTVDHVLNDAIRESEFDVVAISRDADQRISNFKFQADQSRANASQAKMAGYIGAGRTLGKAAMSAASGGISGGATTFGGV